MWIVLSHIGKEINNHAKEAVTITAFSLCYIGMILGRFPRLKLDRTGIALLCAILLMGSRALSENEALKALDIPTLVLLFGLMVVSVQLRLGGFYTKITIAFARLRLSPSFLLLCMMVTMGFLSAIFTNDVICLATTPVIIGICRRRGINPLPYLLGLACAANIGSALTLIGNPQNILIAQTLHLSFSKYIARAFPVVTISLIAGWAIIASRWKGKWLLPEDPSVTIDDSHFNPFDRWETIKGLTVATLLMIIFLGEWWPRELCAITAAGILLTSRRFRSREILSLVDWQLLVLFISLFVINHALYKTRLPQSTIIELGKFGINLHHPDMIFGISVILSNIVSNVPAVMLLLPWVKHPETGYLLAIASTFAGNLLIGGSIANIIVVDQATKSGISISWKDHAKLGIPVTLITLAVAEFIMLFNRL
ncbi:MAG: anion transporter [Thermodesulforhabdaceae bacterium]